MRNAQVQLPPDASQRRPVPLNAARAGGATTVVPRSINLEIIEDSYDREPFAAESDDRQ
jgi:hypothetical protein